jgi:DNA-binding winged helix-turn-helix (wHTH) protein
MRDLQAIYGELEIDSRAWEARLGGAIIDLTRTEFEILALLASRPREVVTDEEITQEIWGDGWFGDDNNLAVHVSKLRHKLGESGSRPRYIRTVRAVGYRFEPLEASPVALSVADMSRKILSRNPAAFELTADAQLRVISVRPDGRRVLGFEPRHLLGNFLPFVAERPWDDHSSALQAIKGIVASGVREWTSRGVVRCADGTQAQADFAVCMEVSSGGRLETVRCVVLVRSDEIAGGGVFADLRTPRRHAFSVSAWARSRLLSSPHRVDTRCSPSRGPR